MGLLEDLSELLGKWAPMLGVTAAVAVGLSAAWWLLIRKLDRTMNRLPRQLGMMAITLIGFGTLLVALPLETELHGQLLSLVGLMFTAVIALSSTSFVANMMGGFMVRAVRSFRAGDFIQIGEQFGRVTERGLFHTEIQTEDRDLVTLPNLYMVTNPVKVVRASGTLVSAKLSLGYDVPRRIIEEQLKEAAGDAGLEGAFVHVVDLGDFSVTYMIAGFLSDIERLLTTRSRLRGAVLDRLHEAGVEIVSPSFMNQRALDPKAPVIPPSVIGPEHPAAKKPADEQTAESVAFDKATKAGGIESLRDELAELHKKLADGPSDEDRGTMERRLDIVMRRIARATEGLSDE